MQSRYQKSNKESVERSIVFKNFFRYFGFCNCNPSKDDDDIRRTSTIPADPASQMEMRLSKMSIQNPPESAAVNTQYALGNKPYSYDQVFVLGHKDKIIVKLTSKTMTNYHSKLAQSQNASPVHNKNREVSHISPLLRPRLPTEAFLKEDFALDNNESISTGISLIPCSDQENQKLSGSNVARYLAHRLKCDVLIDAIGGIGYNLRQVKVNILSDIIILF